MDIDLAAIGAWLRLVWAHLWTLLSSPLAQRIYVVTMGAAVLCASFVLSLRYKAKLDKELAKAVRDIRFPGPKPKDPAKIEAQRRRKQAIILRSLRGVAALFGSGIAVPVALMALGTHFYFWFDPRTAPLLNYVTDTLVYRPHASETAIYLLDQTLRGGLFDLIEVFGFDYAKFANNREAYVYSTSVFLFHMYVEAFALVALWSPARVFWKLYELNRMSAPAPTASLQAA